MNIDNQKIKEILLGGNYITKEDIKKAEEFAKSRHTTIIDVLLSKGIITNDLLGQAIAEAFKVVYADLNSLQPSREQVLKIPEKTAKKLRAVFFAEDKKTVTITTDNPSKKNIIAELQTNFQVKKLFLRTRLLKTLTRPLFIIKKS